MSDTGPRGGDRLLSRSRVALAVGFGSLLLIMMLAGIDALRVLRQFSDNNDRIRERFLFRNHVLNDIRSEVYLSGTYVRDYLLDPEAARAETYRTGLEQVRKTMDGALESYRRELEPGEMNDYRALSGQLDQYWQTLAPILKWGPEERRRSGYAFLRDDVFPRRQNMLAIADRIASINEQQLSQATKEVVGLLRAFQTRLAVTLFAALALGGGMAAFSMRRILKLEHQLQQRFEEVVEARTQLKDLSARLVQAQETERRALSRELHDEVGQSLSAVLIELRNLTASWGTQPPAQARHQVEIIKGLVETSVRVVRNMALLLRPSMLDDLGLVPALRWQAREVSKRTSMDVNVTAEFVEDDLPDEYKTCIYRVVQEALHNCARHSQASSVQIRVRQSPGRLTLTVQDDGRGFDPRDTKGMGLLGIQERVAHLEGVTHVDSKIGGGTLLTVELPVAPESPEKSRSFEADSHPVG